MPANYRWPGLIAEFDRRKGWADGKLPSCARAFMARGELSYSKVRALTRVATPAIEDTLLMYALHGRPFMYNAL